MIKSSEFTQLMSDGARIRAKSMQPRGAGPGPLCHIVPHGGAERSERRALPRKTRTTCITNEGRGREGNRGAQEAPGFLERETGCDGLRACHSGYLPGVFFFFFFLQSPLCLCQSDLNWKVGKDEEEEKGGKS